MSTSPLRTIYFGTPDFAVPPLQALINAPVADLLAVVCQPDRPKGRGRKLTAPPVKELALQHGLPVLQPEKIRPKAFLDEIAALKPDVIVVAAYGKIFPKALLEIPKHGCINIHASLLPRHRGAAPIQWALIMGDEKTGVTIMQMDEGCDTGAIIEMEECEILEDDNTQSVANMLSVLGANKIVEVLEKLASSGKVESVPQAESQATAAPMLRKIDGLLDWTQSAEAITWRIRGVTPWPGAQTLVDDRPMKILDAEPIPAHHPDAEPGQVVELDRRRGFVVATGDGFLLIKRIQPAGKAAMTAVDAVNGNFVKEGDILVAPPLEN